MGGEESKCVSGNSMSCCHPDKQNTGFVVGEVVTDSVRVTPCLPPQEFEITRYRRSGAEGAEHPCLPPHEIEITRDQGSGAEGAEHIHDVACWEPSLQVPRSTEFVGLTGHWSSVYARGEWHLHASEGVSWISWGACGKLMSFAEGTRAIWVLADGLGARRVYKICEDGSLLQTNPDGSDMCDRYKTNPYSYWKLVSEAFASE